MIAGMNWTTWNSVAAKAETNRPSAVPRTASSRATSSSSQGEPAKSRSRNQTATPVASAAWAMASVPKARA